MRNTTVLLEGRMRKNTFIPDAYLIEIDGIGRFPITKEQYLSQVESSNALVFRLRGTWARLNARSKIEEVVNLINEALWDFAHNLDETGATNLVGAQAELHALVPHRAKTLKTKQVRDRP